MQQLVLVLESQMLANEAVTRFGSHTPITGSRRAAIASLLGAPTLMAAAPAEVARHSLAVDRPNTSACFAAPVHIHVGRYGGRLAEPGALALTPEASVGFVDAFRAVFDPADCELRALPDGTFLALIPQLESVTTVDPDDCLDQPIDACLPTGAGARKLRQLSTEIEMWLHAMPMNQLRAAAGLPPITGLWLWGCGEAVTRPRGVGEPRTQMREASGSLAVYSRDSFLLGAGQLLDAAIVKTDRTTIATILADNADFAIADANDTLGTAAVDALRAGSVAQLYVVVRRSIYSLRRRDLLKFWRRRTRAEAIS